ncbi:MAG: UDP-glucose 4-epimerase GalE [Labilithrix sp.]|nr:UDP-glucose 4-epimerase GalE [Labilithrix sp.]
MTGGAGFVGSHMVKTLLAAGHEPVVLDDMSSGHRDAVPGGVPFVLGDVAATRDVTALLRDQRIDVVFHFAARIRVEQSVTDPRLYWQGNVGATLALLDAILDAGTVKAFVQSSTAAVYGPPDTSLLDEDHPKRPESPYGETKLAVERALASYGAAYGLPWAALRYFNAAGADHEAGLCERHDPETHLVPLVLQVAAGERPSISVYGTSWPTPDGTCVRDYVHVTDLCEAHLAAVAHLLGGGASGAFNLGSGEGHSVRAVIAAAREITGHPIPAVDAPPRAGDTAVLVAAVERAARILGWRATRSDLRRIVGDAWAARQRAPVSGHLGVPASSPRLT